MPSKHDYNEAVMRVFHAFKDWPLGVPRDFLRIRFHVYLRMNFPMFTGIHDSEFMRKILSNTLARLKYQERIFYDKETNGWKLMYQKEEPIK
jgi:hypothetical protein